MPLRTAWSRPRIWDVIREEIAKPAASSLAELMRLPVDNCSIATDSARLFLFKAFCEINDLTLVLMTVMG